MKKYDFTRFIIDVNGNVETKRIQTDSEKYLIKNILPKVYDESGSMLMKYFNAKVFYKNNKTNEFISSIDYLYVDVYKRELTIETINNEYEIEYYKNLIK